MREIGHSVLHLAMLKRFIVCCVLLMADPCCLISISRRLLINDSFFTYSRLIIVSLIVQDSSNKYNDNSFLILAFLDCFVVVDKQIFMYAIPHYGVVAERRLTDFVAGLTNDDPVITSPVFKQYHHVQYNGSVPASATGSVSFPSSTDKYRYVIIQNQFHSTDAICLIEVKVFLRGSFSFLSFYCS